MDVAASAVGATTPIDATVLDNPTLWLEIEADTETLSPRQRLLAVPYALRAADTDAVGGLPATFATQVFANFNFDGDGPPNDDPSEGFGDTDNDGIANFVDPDNDNDGLSDAIEVAQGSDINIPTPIITSLSPNSVSSCKTTS